MDYMFNNCTNLISINFDFKKTNHSNYMYINSSKFMFNNCTSLTYLYLSKIKFYENEKLTLTHDYDELLSLVDAVYIISHPSKHYWQIKKALNQGKHVLCESPIALNEANFESNGFIREIKGVE